MNFSNTILDCLHASICPCLCVLTFTAELKGWRPQRRPGGTCATSTQTSPECQQAERPVFGATAQHRRPPLSWRFALPHCGGELCAVSDCSAHFKGVGRSSYKKKIIRAALIKNLRCAFLSKISFWATDFSFKSNQVLANSASMPVK